MISWMGQTDVFDCKYHDARFNLSRCAFIFSMLAAIVLILFVLICFDLFLIQKQGLLINF